MKKLILLLALVVSASMYGCASDRYAYDSDDYGHYGYQQPGYNYDYRYGYQNSPRYDYPDGYNYSPRYNYPYNYRYNRGG